VKIADQQNLPRERIVVSHQILDDVEWPGTTELAEEQAAHYELKFITSRHRNMRGENPSLLDYVERRGKWPSSTTRYCTSDFKRGPGRRVLTALSRERPGRILSVFGFRAEESPSRSKKEVLSLNAGASTKSDLRKVWDWLPIHHWKEREVWEDIRASKVPYHPAYDKGMPRLSCAFCIFAPKGALMISARENPELCDRYLALEEKIGHDFQHKKPLRLIKEALERGEEPPATNGAWNM